jgi:prepilin-type N-terminal cleavage/methylation domain-containing protein
VIRISGFTLLEVLISLFILSLLLLGLDAAETQALRQAKAVYYFNVAREQLNSMVEQLQTTQGAEFANIEAKWNEQNKQILPQGKGQISKQLPQFILSIFWGENIDASCQRNKIGLSGCLRLITKIKTSDSNAMAPF